MNNIQCKKEIIKISYNPYHKSMQYLRKTEDGWVELSNNSELSQDAFQENITMQNHLFEILNAVQKYNTGNVGVQILFEGTDDDFSDLKNVTELYFPDKSITCEKNLNGLTLQSASEIEPKIKQLFNQLEKTFSEHPNKLLQNEIDKYKSTIKSTVTVCVLGTYSAGKSAFINALIGEEVLPSASDPTTANIYRVHNAQDAKIVFHHHNSEIQIHFEGSNYKIQTDMLDDELLTNIQSNIKESSQKTLYAHLYRALEAINTYQKNLQDNNNNEECLQIIDIYVPFQKSALPLDQFDFVFIDTPGADSETYHEHMKITQKALREQTNGIPVIVTGPDDMDKQGNAEINCMLKDIGSSLDNSNTIIAVNKADEKPLKTLLAKKENSGRNYITSWHSKRIFFVSSALGIAAKKNDFMDENSWIDEDLSYVVERSYKSFMEVTDKRYTQLYLCNILSDERMTELCERAKTVSQEDLLAYNSGIRSIEDEISLFAHKYALYNKCLQAQQYLHKAIELAQEEIEGLQGKNNDIQSKLDAKIQTKRDELVQKLDEKGTALKGAIANSNSKKLKKVTNYSLNKIQKKTDSFPELWRSIRSKYSILPKLTQQPLKELRVSLSESFQETMNDYIQATDELFHQFAEKNEEEIKKQLGIIVDESPSLNVALREKLKKTIMSYPPIDIPNRYELQITHAQTIDVFGFFTISINLNSHNMKDTFTQQAREKILNLNEQYQKEYQKIINQWINSLCLALKLDLSDLNPELRNLNQRSLNLQKEISHLKKQNTELQRVNKEILEMLEFKKERQK